tara:strand:+ start:1135 stop:1959 length:825 start_codon:yes stop_codon:yes gene_type:complete
MTEEQTLTYDAGVETTTTEDNLNSDEQESLALGEQMQDAEDGLLAGKYKDTKDLEKAYSELEKKLGEKSEPDSEEFESEYEDEEYEEEYEDEEYEDEEYEEEDPSILDQLWDEGVNSQLSKETFEELQKMDPVEVAKLAMQDRSALLAQNGPQDFSEEDVAQIQGLVGGEENYNNLMDWAQQSIPESEVNMFDSVMEQGNPLAAYFAIQALALRYQDAAGRDGELITGKAPVSNSEVFNSQQELMAAQSDPRYEDDPAYRAAIMQKLERSNIDF